MRFSLSLLPVVLFLPLLPVSRPAAPPRAERHRSPIDLALLPGGRYAVTANHTSDSVSLVDLREGRAVTEVPTGRQPAGIACSRDGKRVAVSHLADGTVTLFDVAGTTLRRASTLAVGPRPRGAAFTPDGNLLVAVSAADEVVTVDPASGKVTRRWEAPREPWALAVSPDGTRAAASSARTSQVRIWELATGKLLGEREVAEALNMRGVCFTRDGESVLAAHAARRGLPPSDNNIASGWVIGNRMSRHGVKSGRSAEQIPLDPRGEAVGDLHGLAFDDAGRTLTATASGTQEVLLYRYADLKWVNGVPFDLVDSELTEGGGFRRVRLGGRPLAVAHRPGTSEAVVANYLLDAVQIVDTAAGKLTRTVHLGTPATPGLARRGEALFYDARRSRHQWFSCHTCHSDGHTTGHRFDTFNDDSEGNPKLTPTLRGVTRTAPYTWHGWQTSLEESISNSFTDTMRGRKPTKEELRAVVAYLATLEVPPSPHRAADGGLTPAAKRGQKLFEEKARCVRCHKGPDYTTPKTFDVGLEPDGSPYETWNPPSLRGLWDRGPYLHDGRAKTLDDLLQTAHPPEKLGGAALTPAERADLIAFLRSL